mgnify:CR=1 FL=1
MDDIINVLADCVGAAFYLGVIVGHFIYDRTWITIKNSMKWIMQSMTGIPGSTQSWMSSLTECAQESWNNALWDTHNTTCRCYTCLDNYPAYLSRLDRGDNSPRPGHVAYTLHCHVVCHLKFLVLHVLLHVQTRITDEKAQESESPSELKALWAMYDVMHGQVIWMMCWQIKSFSQKAN